MIFDSLSMPLLVVLNIISLLDYEVCLVLFCSKNANSMVVVLFVFFASDFVYCVVEIIWLGDQFWPYLIVLTRLIL